MVESRSGCQIEQGRMNNVALEIVRVLRRQFQNGKTLTFPQVDTFQVPPAGTEVNILFLLGPLLFAECNFSLLASGCEAGQVTPLGGRACTTRNLSGGALQPTGLVGENRESIRRALLLQPQPNFSRLFWRNG